METIDIGAADAVTVTIITDNTEQQGERARPGS